MTVPVDREACARFEAALFVDEEPSDELVEFMDRHARECDDHRRALHLEEVALAALLDEWVAAVKGAPAVVGPVTGMGRQGKREEVRPVGTDELLEYLRGG